MRAQFWQKADCTDPKNPKPHEIYKLQNSEGVVAIAPSHPKVLFTLTLGKFQEAYPDAWSTFLDTNWLDSGIPNKELLELNTVLESARAQVKDLKKQKFLGKRGVDAVAWPPLDKFFPNADWVVGESQ